MKKSLVFLGILATSLFILPSCSKDKSPVNPGPTATKNIKFTISTPGLSTADDDNVTISLAGSDGSGNNTLWKVNGVTRNNEQGILISDDDLASGGTIVIESVKPLMAASLDISALNFGANTFKLNFKAEVNGTVQNDISETIGTNTYIKDFSY